MPLHPLAPLAYTPLPLGAVRPRGWLARQLRIQADGLTGRLDEFWPDVADSKWIGGEADGWERMPYWLDGAVPLAYVLDDALLQGKVAKALGYILDHQESGGWLGPDTSRPDKPRDPWPIYVIMKALIQFEEATADARVIPALLRQCKALDAHLDAHPLFDWNRMRWQDGAWCVHRLFERTGEEGLLDLAKKLHDQGYDWRNHFMDLPFKEQTPKWEHESHVVNNAMGLKAPTLWWRQSGHEPDRDASLRGIAELDRYHGMPTGVFTGDECLAGRSPSQGTELCAVVEYMFSLEVLLAVSGEPAFGDRLERIAYNALPAPFSPEMWTHQYDQQVNQVMCTYAENHVWATNGPDANLFGLEPHFGCCLANMHQGWPKFASHLWMKTPQDGLAAVALAPSEVAASCQGARVTVTVDADYPFGDTLTFCVRPEEPVTFPLDIRIPGWTEGAELTVEGEPAVEARSGTFHRIEREWRGETEVSLRLPMPVRAQRGFNDAVSIERGPLVYALPVKESWQVWREAEPVNDYEVYPAAPWNVALWIREDNPGASADFAEGPVGACPFSPEGAPVRGQVKGRLLPEWTIEKSAAAPPPQSPVRSEEPLIDLPLVPYGCANLRVTEFPVLEG